MKRFLFKLSVLAVLILLGCFFLSEIRFSDGFIIYKTKDTPYEKVAWNINFLNERGNQISGSTIFLGSSLVQGGVNDSILNENGLKTINMGLPHNGNEIPLYFLNRIKNKKPKKVFFLKGKTPFQDLHKMTPLLYTASGILKSGQTINLEFVRFLFKKTKLSLEYCFYQEKTLKVDHRKYGIIFDENAIPKETFENKIKNKSPRKGDEYYNLYKNDFLYRDEKEGNTLVNWVKVLKRKAVYYFWSNNNFLTNVDSQENFIETALDISVKNNIEFSKIYIPKLIDVNNYKGYQRASFKATATDRAGVLFITDHTFLRSIEHWADPDHLDESGANLFTHKLLEHLR